MSFHDFIFSNKRQIRFRRHLLFWICWCFYFALTFLVPTYWVPAWNLKGPMPQIEKYGVLISIFRILMNSVLMTVVHMVLVYGIIYYFLPGILSKRWSWFRIIVQLFLFVIVVACFNYLNFLMTFSISTRMGFFAKMPDMSYILPIWFRQIVFNYPTVVGFALAIKLLKRWYLKQKETEIIVRERIQAELQLLKSQVHPHFLFNTLNNIYSFILNDSDKAPDMIKKLSNLLRYILNECDQPLVTLEKEIIMIKDYIALEQIRYGNLLNLSLHIQGNPVNKMISPLLLIPFIENSFKHGTSRTLVHPWIKLEIIIEENFLEFKLSNNKPERQNESQYKKGIGLANVKKRLTLLYPETHSLRIIENEMSYDVFMRIQLHVANEEPVKLETIYSNKDYALV